MEHFGIILKFFPLNYSLTSNFLFFPTVLKKKKKQQTVYKCSYKHNLKNFYQSESDQGSCLCLFSNNYVLV